MRVFSCKYEHNSNPTRRSKAIRQPVLLLYNNVRTHTQVINFKVPTLLTLDDKTLVISTILCVGNLFQCRQLPTLTFWLARLSYPNLAQHSPSPTVSTAWNKRSTLWNIYSSLWNKLKGGTLSPFPQPGTFVPRLGTNVPGRGNDQKRWSKISVIVPSFKGATSNLPTQNTFAYTKRRFDYQHLTSKCKQCRQLKSFFAYTLLSFQKRMEAYLINERDAPTMQEHPRTDINW